MVQLKHRVTIVGDPQSGSIFRPHTVFEVGDQTTGSNIKPHVGSVYGVQTAADLTGSIINTYDNIQEATAVYYGTTGSVLLLVSTD